MFHLFTLQGKRIDTQLEHIPRSLRVHHARSNNRVRKFTERESAENPRGSNGAVYGIEQYRESSVIEYEKTRVFHASEIMSTPVFTIEPDVLVKDAWMMFIEKRVHHMPVVDSEGKLTGILSDRDLLKNIVISGEKVETVISATVRDVMSEEVIAASLLTDIKRIAKAMTDNHIGAMPVVNEDSSIAGIITRGDILNAVVNLPGLNLWA